MLAIAIGLPVRAQLPFASAKASGQTVTPVFEGWYRNPDGTFSISFGYFNRNTQEVVDVPIGPNNFIEPGAQNQGQPTEFQPRRHWGVFAVKVPADFGEKTVTWTLKLRGASYAIPGNLRANWQIDALEGEAGSGNTPPALKFDANGAGRQRPIRHHGRSDCRDGWPADHAERLGARRWPGVDQRGERRPRRRTGVARLVQASGPRQGDVRSADRPRRCRRSQATTTPRSAHRGITSCAFAPTTRRVSPTPGTRSAAGPTGS